LIKEKVAEWTKLVIGLTGSTVEVRGIENIPQNGTFVPYAPASKPARELMPEAYRNNESIFPSEEAMANSFVILPKDPHTSRLMTQLYQRLMAIK